MDEQNLENKVDQVVFSDRIRIMCRVFWGADLDSCRQMADKTFFRPFETALSKKEKTILAILDDMNSVINKFETHPLLFDHLNACYVRLFINDKAGIIPLYQSCYEFENAPMMGISAEKMMDRFKSKGLSVGNAINEPPDHIAIELEYLFFLLQEGNTGGKSEVDNTIPVEAASFASETMLPWITHLNRRLETASDECRFYYLAGKMLAGTLERIAGMS